MTTADFIIVQQSIIDKEGKPQCVTAKEADCSHHVAWEHINGKFSGRKKGREGA